MSKYTIDKFIETFSDLVVEEGYANSLMIVSPLLIYIAEKVAELNGAPKEQEIRIESDKDRSICIEAVTKDEEWGL